MAGLDFYTHINRLSENKDIEYDSKLGRAATYPELLSIAHFYAFHGATKAIAQIPIEDITSSMAQATDGMTALRISIQKDDQRNVRNFLQNVLTWESN